MRGVHFAIRTLVSLSSGSSPHARGPRGFRDFKNSYLGIIPACAGSTDVTRPRRTWKRDHPRMRGVHEIGDFDTLLYEGSSPHARGPRLKLRMEPSSMRIIPACAGSTWSSLQNIVRFKDHPRMRGVHTKKMPKIRHFSWRYDPISFNFKNTCCVKMQSSKARCFCSSSPKCSARVFNL